MIADDFQGDFLVLTKSDLAEKFTRLQIFHSEHGLLSALIRNSARTNRIQGAGPDICDEATAKFSKANSGNMLFMSDYSLVRRHSALGSHYQKLLWASRLIQALLPNLAHIEESQAAYQLIRISIESIAEKPLPEAAYCKCLFRLARSEGYPMGEGWLKSIHSGLREAALSLLQVPLTDLRITPEKLEEVRLSLEAFLRQHTDIQVSWSTSGIGRDELLR